MPLPSKILVTGAAGFIGYHLCEYLLAENHTVIGIDNLNSYYSVELKQNRLNILQEKNNFSFYQMDIEQREAIENLFATHHFDCVVNLAAQAGVRHSATHPHVYVNTNVVGFLNILEGCRHMQVKHLVYASSSSVHGANTQQPCSELHNTVHPISIYGATKKANELMAHAYASLYGLPCTGLRFFTVYGPWGRPDMALFKFTDLIMNNQPVELFNYGDMQRAFTYIDDIVESIGRVIKQPATADLDWTSKEPIPASSNAPYRIYNIGNNTSIKLEELVDALEQALGKKAIRNYLPQQLGDPLVTQADTSLLQNQFGYTPETPLKVGIQQFVDWYAHYWDSK